MPLPSLYVATPAYGGVVNTTYLRAVMALAALCRERGVGFEVATLDGCGMITHARNSLAHAFLAHTGHSHLLFIDADMGFEAADIMTMLDYREHEVSAIVCPQRRYNWAIIRDAVRRNPDIDPALLGNLGGQYTGMFHLPPGVETMPIGPEPVEVGAIGTGIMLIARALLERMLASGEIPAYRPSERSPPIPEFFRAGVIDGGLQGEDIYFCNLVRRYGATIRAFPGFTITHSGVHSYIGDLPGIVDHYSGPIQTPME